MNPPQPRASGRSIPKQSAGDSPTPSITYAHVGWRESHLITAAGLICTATLLCYLPAMCGRFIWDDDAHITKPELRSFSGLYRIWFEVGATQQYYPLLHSTFWIEHRLWGDSTLG